MTRIAILFILALPAAQALENDSLETAKAALQKQISKDLEARSRQAEEEFWRAENVAAVEALLEKTARKPESELVALYDAGARDALERIERIHQLSRTWLAVLRGRAEGKTKEALMQLSTLRYYADSSTASDGAKLRERIRSTSRALGVPSGEEAEKQISEMVQRVLAAKAAKDVDPLLGEMRERQEMWNAVRDLIDPSTAALAERASRFARIWQDYLAAKAGGNSERTRKALDMLAGDDFALPGVQRSMLLELSLAENSAKPGSTPTPAVAKPGRSRFDELLVSCKTLADLEKLLPELKQAVRSNEPPFYPAGNPVQAMQTLSELESIHREYEDAKATPFPKLESKTPPKQPPVTRPGFPRSGAEAPVVYDLKQQLAVFILAKHFGEPAQPNDSATQYLRRRLLVAREADDWTAVKRVMETAATLDIRDNICLPEDAEALTQYIAGVNYAEAGVSRMAVASLLKALKYGSTNLPIADIKARLARIRTEEAAEYAAGLEMAQRGDSGKPR